MAKRLPAPLLSLPEQDTLKAGHRRGGWSAVANQEELAALRDAFDGPDGPEPFQHVRCAKWRGYDGHYVLCRVQVPGKQPFYADLARGGRGQSYQFQNDCIQLTEDQWRRVTMRGDCDWFDLHEPEQEEEET